MHVANVCIAVSCAPEPHGHVSLPQRDRLLGPNGREGVDGHRWRVCRHAHLWRDGFVVDTCDVPSDGGRAVFRRYVVEEAVVLYW